MNFHLCKESPCSAKDKECLDLLSSSSTTMNIKQTPMKLGKILCMFGFHKKYTTENKITENTSNYTTICLRDGKILRAYGGTHFGPIRFEITKDKQL